MGNNQKGLTLIELLATLAVLSIVGILVWSVFIQGTKFSNQAVTNNQMQQEANYIISRLTKIHQTSVSYKIDSIDCKIGVSYTNKIKTQQSETFENSNFCLSTSSTELVDPNLNETFLTITVEDIRNSENRISIETVLYRLKGGE